MNASVDAAILALTQQGRLTATSCLSSGPSWPTNAPRLRELTIDAGLHLNFTEAFGPDDFCLPLARLIRACYLRRLSKSRIREQIERQFDRFELHFGRAPDFVDGHQHVHQLPLIRDALMPIIERRYAGQPLWLRCTAAPAMLSAFRLKARIIAALGSQRLSQMVQRQGRAQNRHLLGVYDFSGSAADYASLMKGWLEAASDGDLLMCHPAASIVSGDAIGTQRPVEMAVLASSAFADLCVAAGVERVRLSQIL